MKWLVLTTAFWGGTAFAGELNFEDPASCAGCHQQIVAEWSQSMHSQAHHSKDPIYNKLRTLRMTKNPAIVNGCAKCHTPQAKTPEGPLGVHGVSCATCHATAEILPHGKGADRLKPAAPGMLLGPHDLPAGRSPMHGTGPAPAHMKQPVTLCMTCHNQVKNKAGLVMCDTGPEWSKGEKADCSSCHMPKVAGKAGTTDPDDSHPSHRFLGPRSSAEALALLKPADLEARFEDTALVVTVINRSGHSMPTGFPGRMMRLHIVGESTTGETVWRPEKMDPKTLFKRSFFDGKGKPTLPPMAQKEGPDTRLKPGGTRTIRFEVPTTVKHAKVALQWFAVPPPVAQKLGLMPHPTTRPRVAGQTEARRQ